MAELILRSEFSLRLRLRSDWHVGTGAGQAGASNRLVKRDERGLPFVPAKTLTGVWRDACERVAWALDGGRTGAWAGWVEELFGEQPALRTRPGAAPRPARLSVRPLHFSSRLGSVLASRPLLLEAATFVKPGVALDPRSGRAGDGLLRFEEMARGGVELTGVSEVELGGDDEQRRAASALLVAGARLVERLGGKRRRGAGRCELEIEGAGDPAPWLDWLEAHAEPPPRPARAAARPPASPGAAGGGDWWESTLDLTLETPLVIRDRTAGNTGLTLDFVPGSLLLPVVAGRLGGLTDLRAAIASGDLLVTCATLQVGDGAGRPVPFALHRRKAGSQALVNLLSDSRDGAQLKPLRTGWIGGLPASGAPRLGQVSTRIAMHNVVDDEAQRPTQALGGVYAYQCISAGQRLRATLRVRRPVVEALARADAAWWQRLASPWRLGVAKKDDYGRVQVTAGAPSKVAPPSRPASSRLVVWLASDLLRRDERLRPAASAGALADALGAALGVKLRSAGPGFSRSRRLDSWQVRWGLPRPSLQGLRAGSCFVFEADGPLDPGRLAEVAAAGLGERRAEGFGQVLLDDPLLATALAPRGPANGVPGPEQRQAAPLDPRDLAVETARVFERAAWREAIRRAALRVASRPEERAMLFPAGYALPPPSQLGAFRKAFGTVTSVDDLGAVTAWLEGLDEKPKRAQKWGHQRDVLARVFSKEGRGLLWSALQLPEEQLCATANGAEVMRHELWGEAVRTTYDAIVRELSRERGPAREEG